MMWRNKCASGSTELQGQCIAARKEVQLVSLRRRKGEKTGFRMVQGGVKGSNDNEYFVLAYRIPRFGVHCACQCPDRRDGYCKHAVALLLKTELVLTPPGSHEGPPEWLKSAWSSQPGGEDIVAPEFNKEALKAFGKKVDEDVTVLDTLDSDDCITVLRNAYPLCGSSISKLFGGEGSKSESYQSMSMTKLFDTLTLLKEEPLERLKWCILYLIYDEKHDQVRALLHQAKGNKKEREGNDDVAPTKKAKISSNQKDTVV